MIGHPQPGSGDQTGAASLTARAAAAAASASSSGPGLSTALKPAMADNDVDDGASGVVFARFEKVYWPFIVGMLTNAGPMGVGQIATMLRLAGVSGAGAVDGAGGGGGGVGAGPARGKELAEETLRDFLDAMVADERLDMLAGARYRVRS